ncbi:NAD-dependent succinate-semialdehyde dehydrogenase [Nocardioides seonyuensis]|uniref:NAD-dependent succinate-semialdehyde dehydrogenase n=1 Tax=Nocardioides seonyuensis TaxID=2518371 RepID=A0A4V1BM38_9ACTN|nr:NAD-dependent succinate-semialdehyde dehydrogenase [Nocardioides seonyuensis]QBX55022.1 NAD-dependent succinate-semialdehyde dehydrogenase [Nocardioides seonyuensis]
MNEKAVLGKVPTGLFIAGEWRDATGGGTTDVEDPATGKTLATVASAAADDGRAALDAAVAVQGEWAATPPRERAELLRSAFDLLTERADEFAMLMTLEMGKPLAQSKGEVTYGAEFFRWFSEEVVRIAGRWSASPDGNTRLLTMKQPVGPVLMITPWNFPLAMGTRKIGPAIAAGCTMVVKPAQQTPLTMLALADLLREVGVPPGVVNVVSTHDTSDVMEPLIGDPRLRKLTFTGSTPVGQMLVKQSADQLLRVSMELGGNAPFLVFPDADLDRAVDGAMLAKMRNMGEACTAANRFLVHADVAEEFGRRFGERMAAERVGRGTEDGVTVGPLIDRKAQGKVAELVDDAVSKGATVVTGGSTTGEAGYFFEPTVLTDVPAEAELNQEEIFGPVAPITTFTSDDEALRLANSTPFGLVAYAFTQDLSRTIRVSEALEFGMVGINQGIVSNPAAPFGGVKHSGFGREGGPEGIEEYLSVKYVGIAP